MRTLRAASIVLAFIAATALVLGTAGFTAMHADRGLDVSITDDESAFLGYDTLTDTVHDGESTPVVTYHNQFERDLGEFRVDVSIVDPDDTDARLVDDETPDGLPSTTSETVDVALGCPVEEEVHLQFEATGSGGGVSVSIDRIHAVTCVPDGPGDPGVTEVNYDDAANADIDTEGSDGSVTAIVLIVDSPPVDTSNPIEPTAFDETKPLDADTLVHASVEDGRVVVGDAASGSSGSLIDELVSTDALRTTA